MKSYRICKGDSVECQRSLRIDQLQDKDHSMSNYIKLQSSDLKRKECKVKSKNKGQQNKSKNKK
jgi:hypothetical protein